MTEPTKRPIPKNTDLRHTHSAGPSMDSAAKAMSRKDAMVVFGGMLAAGLMFFNSPVSELPKKPDESATLQSPAVTADLDNIMACAFMVSDPGTNGRMSDELQKCLADAAERHAKKSAAKPIEQTTSGKSMVSGKITEKGAGKPVKPITGKAPTKPGDIKADVSALRKTGTLQAWKEDLSREIAGYWRLEPMAAKEIVSSVIHSAETHKVDPFLVLGVIAVESSFKNTAVSHKNAEGLMQVIRRWHPEEISGIASNKPMTPTQNIAVGTRVLKKYIDRNGGNVTAALQGYNGASGDPTEKYARKVMIYRERFANSYKSFASHGKERTAMNDTAVFSMDRGLSRREAKM